MALPGGDGSVAVSTSPQRLHQKQPPYLKVTRSGLSTAINGRLQVNTKYKYTISQRDIRYLLYLSRECF